MYKYVKNLVFVFILIAEFVNAQNFLPITKDGKWGFIDSSGTVVVEPIYQNIGDFSGDNCTICEQFNCGLLNKNRGLIVPVAFRDIQIVTDELSIVTNQKGERSYFTEGSKLENLKYYESIKIAKEGEPILLLNNKADTTSTLYAYGSIFSIPKSHTVQLFGDYFVIGNKHSYGLIDRKGNLIHAMAYKSIESFSDDYYLLEQDGEFGLYQDGFELLPTNYTSIIEHVFDGELLVSKSDKYGVYDLKTQSWLFDPLFFMIRGYWYKQQKLYEVYKNRDFLKLYNQKKELLYTGSSTDYKIQEFGVVLNKEEKGWRFSSIKYHVIDLLFDKVSAQRDGFYLVKKDASLGLVNKYGKLVLRPNYNDIALLDDQIRAIGFNGEATIFTFDSDLLLTEKSRYKKFTTLTIASKSNLKADFKRFNFGRSFEDRSSTIKVKAKKDKVLAKGRYTTAESGKFKCLYDNQKSSCVSGYMFSEVELEVFNFTDKPYARVVFPSGRMGLVSRSGKIISNLEVKEVKKGMTTTKTLGFVSPFDTNGLARFCVNVPILKKVNKEDILDGKVLFANKGGWGVIDDQGKVVVEPYFKNITDIENGKVYLQNPRGFFGVVNFIGDTLVPFKFNGFEKMVKGGKTYYKSVINHSKWSVFNQNGRSITDAKYQKVGEVNQGYMSVRRDYKWTMIDPDGKELQKPSFQRIGMMNNELVPVRIDNKWGYMDTNGKLVIDCQYQMAGKFGGEVMAVKQKGLYGLIDKNNNWVVKPKFLRIYSNHNGYLIAKSKKKQGVINAKGNWVISPMYNRIKNLDDQYFVADVLFDKERLYTIEGKRVSKKSYKKIESVGDGLFIVENNNGMGLIDSMGNELLSIKDYRWVKNYSEGTIQVKVKGDKYWELLDTAGIVLVEDKIKKIYPMKNQVLLINQGSSYFYINKDGQKVMDGSRDVQYDNGLFPSGKGMLTFRNSFGKILFKKESQEMKPFNGDIAILKKIDSYQKEVIRGTTKFTPIYTYSMMNKYGFDLTLPIYDKFKYLDDNYTAMQTKSIYGLFDEDMNEVISPRYESLQLISQTVLKVFGGTKVGYYNLASGQWIWTISG